MATAVATVVAVVAVAVAVAVAAAAVAMVVVAMVAVGGSDAASRDMVGVCVILLHTARRAMCCRSNSGVLCKTTISCPRPAQPVADSGIKMKDYTRSNELVRVEEMVDCCLVVRSSTYIPRISFSSAFCTRINLSCALCSGTRVNGGPSDFGGPATLVQRGLFTCFSP